mmetsp:Transcript_16530/g.27111  ORF Transcript_16530/g.27111 Transcript_16530/m.27111 type:complete len:258 (+) Transcript_16530:52-825(+)
MQPRSENDVLAALQKYGPAPGGKKLLDLERENALWSLQSEIYATYRSVSTNKDCTRIGPSSKCFCAHNLSDHDLRSPMVKCKLCRCKHFAYVPCRPEEIGEWWLVRRKEFKIHEWVPKCRCGHGPFSHAPDSSRRCSCTSCKGFSSHFLCLNCDGHWEDHDCVFETEAERRAAGRPVGDAYMPLHETPAIADCVFGAKPPGPSLVNMQRKIRPANPSNRRPQIKGTSVEGLQVTNRRPQIQSNKAEGLQVTGRSKHR